MKIDAGDMRDEKSQTPCTCQGGHNPECESDHGAAPETFPDGFKVGDRMAFRNRPGTVITWAEWEKHTNLSALSNMKKEGIPYRLDSDSGGEVHWNPVSSDSIKHIKETVKEKSMEIKPGMRFKLDCTGCNHEGMADACPNKHGKIFTVGRLFFDTITGSIGGDASRACLPSRLQRLVPLGNKEEVTPAMSPKAGDKVRLNSEGMKSWAHQSKGEWGQVADVSPRNWTGSGWSKSTIGVRVVWPHCPGGLSYLYPPEALEISTKVKNHSGNGLDGKVELMRDDSHAGQSDVDKMRYPNEPKKTACLLCGAIVYPKDLRDHQQRMECINARETKPAFSNPFRCPGCGLMGQYTREMVEGGDACPRCGGEVQDS